ncbi:MULTISPECIES: methyl-accepting chemotaxis protein [unclassified Janthinobacterium]|uniref:methyl-accepting chemotaxis protein n=1 Tax=unclassified Janthinobacterium TaxID=2610881 RepID=UPI00087E3DE8|nr:MULTISPECIES: methyl-accepting chemotaxis protein [unclassified Janthinobacterium]SDA80697.1 methyl-accepting chemotaxis sensory transducer with Cache sensor [Janthinobacterium sp. 551a]SFB38774.1 methyl-accepting chemotaxis sensory transducer with Cache sensor [Janthinobacterium sp. 344]
MLSSLRTRLVLICVAIVVLSMLALSVANYVTTRNSMLASADQQMQQLLQSQSAVLAQWVDGKKKVMASIVMSADTPEPLRAFQIAEKAGDFAEVFIGYADKRSVFTKPGRPADFDPTARAWYTDTVKAGVPMLTPPYVDAASHQLVVSFTAPVGPQGALTGVAGADVLLDTVIANVVAIKPTPHSFAFLIDQGGSVIAHANKALSLQPVSKLDASLSAAQINRLESARQSEAVRLDGRDGMLYVTRVAGTDWLLAVVLDQQEAMQALQTMLTTASVTAVLLTALAAALLSLLVFKMLKRLELVRDALEDIASGEGDLTRRLDASGVDELAQIAGAFNRFIDKIAAVLVKIRTASESVKESSMEIAAGNQDLSSRTEQQASSLEETAASMEELTSTVKQNADNARQANQMAVSASDVASKGGMVVAQVVDTMASINDSSKKIVDIISVIDGIAFQTNILALNAAVEAARAGEQGRGFAVVATEVRSLAQRSAGAAKEIKLLIDDSVEKVDTGARLVDEAGATMQEIVDSVRRVTDIMGEITSASVEQSSGIEQVNQAIAQMDQVTQQNAALVEEAAAAAESLQDQATTLSQVVGVFKLDDGPVAVQPPARPVVRAAVAPRIASRPAATAAAKPERSEEWETF